MVVKFPWYQMFDHFDKFAVRLFDFYAVKFFGNL
jgi:hypothetical protein